jgi:hypothetical protein
VTETLDAQQTSTDAQCDSMMKAEPQQEHAWLQRLVGQWEYEHELPAEPGGDPPAKLRGTERVCSVGGLWIVAEGEGEMPGGGHATILMTLGYDPRMQRFVGTWLGSMMTHLWLYDGALDAAERVLTLESDGPSLTVEGAMAKYRDVIELVSDDHRVLHSQVLGEDGQWQQFMTAHYRRKK